MKKPLKAHLSRDKNAKNRAIATKNRATAIGSVRIIGGQFKRRSVTFIDIEGLRPTPDRLRETLFNWLLKELHGARVLDSCAGSGVLGFEALSRGAAHCTFIETSQAQSVLLEKTAQQLQITTDNYRVITGAAEKVLNQDGYFNTGILDNDIKQPFDVVFIDPPYEQDLWQPILTALIMNNLITTKTFIYLEANKDLSEQLNALTLSLNAIFIEQGLNGFECIKQTKVGQVVAGLYGLSPS